MFGIIEPPLRPQDRMLKSKSIFKPLTKTGPFIAVAIAIAILTSVAPASAQFFDFPGFGGRRSAPPRNNGWGGGWFGGEFFSPYHRQPQQQPQSQPRQDFSRAPPPARRGTNAARNVLVIGDSMADWLAYGLEEAYAEQPDMGVLRRHKTASGLIKYQPKGEPSDWAAAARGILQSEKPDVIVVMLGLNDRIAIQEPAPDKSDKPSDKNDKNTRAKQPGKPTDAKNNVGNDANTKPDGTDAVAKPDDKSIDSELPQDDADTQPAKSARSHNGLNEFRDDRWVELYSKKIDELIGVLKSKGVPVLWVGLPAIRGQKGTADMLFLDSLYREGANKAGITYVDVWDGFVDEAGSYLQKGPDFEGQIRQLRSSDGVHFTKPGARKLAHYVEREITRLLANRPSAITLPSEPATPDNNIVPGQPAPRPLAGPIVPLAAASISTDQLLGGPGSRTATIDALAARTLVNGEPLAPPAGRADDYSWPRREVGREQAKEPKEQTKDQTKDDSPAATTSESHVATSNSERAVSVAPQKMTPRRPAVQQPTQQEQSTQSSVRDFFGFGDKRRSHNPDIMGRATEFWDDLWR